MTDDGEQRDEELGAALRQLDVPPGREDFYPRLIARLEAEAEHAQAKPMRSRWRWTTGSPLWLGAAAAVLVVVLLVSWVGLPGGRLGPRRAEAITADEVRARVDAALARLRTLTGELHIDYYPSVPDPPPYDPAVPDRRPPEHFTFALTAAGDFRVDGLHDNSLTAYSSAQGSQRSFSTAPGASTLATELTGLAPGPPDPSPTPTELSRSLGSLVRSFLRTNADVPVEESSYDGRAAWRLVVPASVGNRADELDVTVDQQTGFPLRVIEKTGLPGGAERFVSRDLRLSKLVVDGPLTPDTFVPPYPPGAPAVRPVDRGYQRVQQRDVAAAVGYAPLVPQRVPSGFELAEVAVATAGAPTATGNPPSRNVVAMAWQRGFDRVVVTTRETGPDRSRWKDPFAAEDPRTTGVPEPITVATGAVAGGVGEFSLPTESGPHAWVATDRFVVTVAGDLTREELLTILGSLEPAR
ncbi:MAG: hypothetical protein ACRD2W_19930 [Acidimicrobiales bacterium]